MSKGFSKEDVAAKLGISRDTLYQWCKVFPEFSDTIKRGQVLSEAYWTHTLYEAAIGKRPEVNPTLIIFIMKARFSWKDRPSFQENKIDNLLSEPEKSSEESISETERVRRLFKKYSMELVIGAEIKDKKNNKHINN